MDLIGPIGGPAFSSQTPFGGLWRMNHSISMDMLQIGALVLLGRLVEALDAASHSMLVS